MSIKTNAEQIRDEVLTGANTAARVGGNLVEIADDLIAKQAEIDLNTAKVGITTGQTSAIVLNTDKISFDSTSSTRLANTSGTNTGDQDLSGKQNTLVSGTNIKTINGSTLLGSGDLVISGGGGGITGSGTINKLAKFTASGAVGDSEISDNGSLVTIGKPATINGVVTILKTSNAAQDIIRINRFGGSAMFTLAISAFDEGQLFLKNDNGVNILTITRSSGDLNVLGQITGGGLGVNALGIKRNLDTTVLSRFTTASGDTFGDNYELQTSLDADGFNPIIKWNRSRTFIKLLPLGGNVTIATNLDNGTDRLQVNGSAIVTTLKTSGFTVATLPTPPAQGLGARAHVTDALNPTYLGTLTGGGTVKCPVFYNGTNWVSA